MTIALAIAVPEGLVLAADSRSTYANPKQWPRVASDNACKVFRITDHVGAATFGWAMLSGRTIKSHMAEVAMKFKDARVNDVLPDVIEYFDREYRRHVEANPKDEPPEGSTPLGFLVAGYDGNGIGQVYRALIPGGKTPEAEIGTFRPGIIPEGQTDIVWRLIRGYDPRLRLEELPAEAQLVLKASEYQIYFARMVLQDAIDFAILLARTTMETQRFTDGILADPGDIPGVGGSVDVAILTSTSGFRWIQRKCLHGETGPSVATLTYEP